MTKPMLGWLSIFRMGLVQTALGAIVVLTTSTLNRVMVIELALPALLPGLLVTWHHALQVLRPRWGHGSDTGGRRTPWIIGGMAVLAVGGALSAAATALMATHQVAGVVVAWLGFSLVGIGAGATGTSLLALLATHVVPERRAPAATIVWLMMIAGFIVTTIAAGSFLDPFSPLRLIAVTSVVSIVAFALATAAILGVEPKQDHREAREDVGAAHESPGFKMSLGQVWSEPEAKRFTIFIFVSMLAYSMQDLILEPFAGIVFQLTPGETTKLSGVQNGGVFIGMLLVAVAASARFGFGSLRSWVIGGCMASGAALIAIVTSAKLLHLPFLKASIFLLGFSNGVYAVAAIGSMMALAGTGHSRREGMRMGIWGASQALAFGLGGFFGTAAADALRVVTAQPAAAYSTVFFFEAGLFVVAAGLALRAVGGESLPDETSMNDRESAAHPSVYAGG